MPSRGSHLGLQNQVQPTYLSQHLNAKLQMSPRIPHRQPLSFSPPKPGMVLRTNNQRRISICQFSTFRWTFEEDVARYAAHGFNSMGIWRRKVEDDRSAAIDLLYENKMSVSSVHWAGGFTGDGTSFTEAVDDAIDAIEFASRVDAGCLIVHPGARNGHTTSHATRLFHSAMSELVDVAQDYGVQLALEPCLSRKSNEWTFFDRFQDSLNVLQEYDSQALGLVLDLFDVGFDSAIFDSLDKFVERISLVQIADRKSASGGSDATPWLRLAPGQGDCRLDQWLSRLQSLGYGGQFELEVHGTPGLNYFDLLDQAHDYFNEASVDRLLTAPLKTEDLKKAPEIRIAPRYKY